jgi:rRNA-processing protein FCF1
MHQGDNAPTAEKLRGKRNCISLFTGSFEAIVSSDNESDWMVIISSCKSLLNSLSNEPQIIIIVLKTKKYILLKTTEKK